MLKNVCIIITFSYKELFANSCSLEKTITQTITYSILYLDISPNPPFHPTPINCCTLGDVTKLCVTTFCSSK